MKQPTRSNKAFLSATVQMLHISWRKEAKARMDVVPTVEKWILLILCADWMTFWSFRIQNSSWIYNNECRKIKMHECSPWLPLCSVRTQHWRSLWRRGWRRKGEEVGQAGWEEEEVNKEEQGKKTEKTEAMNWFFPHIFESPQLSAWSEKWTTAPCHHWF